MPRSPKFRTTSWTAERQRGTNNIKAKLTDEDILEIFERYAKGNVTQKMLANRFGVSQPTICHILTGRTWSHVND